MLIEGILMTVIGDFVKIDNQVHIAHNCKIGKNSILTGKSAISGSVELGENVILAGDVGIADNISIGSNSTFCWNKSI